VTTYLQERLGVDVRLEDEEATTAPTTAGIQPRAVRTDSAMGKRNYDTIVERLTKQLQVDQQKWLRQLAEEPSRFGELEVSIHQAFQQLADQLVASLLAEATHQSPALEAGKKK
jgi:broad specificity phosphatase PhoE